MAPGSSVRIATRPSGSPGKVSQGLSTTATLTRAPCALGKCGSRIGRCGTSSRAPVLQGQSREFKPQPYQKTRVSIQRITSTEGSVTMTLTSA
jgi:hypothetical protein